jgi:Fe-S cluster biogenesis protein NfuA
MPEPEPPRNLRASGERIEQALAELEECRNPTRSLALAEELLRLMSDLYGAGLAQVVALVGERDPALLSELADDELVGSLLLVHGLHPSSLEARVEGALAKVRPFLGRHGGDVELLAIDDALGAVKLRLLGSCDGCPSSAATLQGAVEVAILEAAPEVTRIVVEESAGGDGVEGSGAVSSGGSGRGEGQGQGTSVPITLSTKPLYTECPAEVSAL